jgi:hypothetical protein
MYAQQLVAYSFEKPAPSLKNPPQPSPLKKAPQPSPLKKAPQPPPLKKGD